MHSLRLSSILVTLSLLSTSALAQNQAPPSSEFLTQLKALPGVSEVGPAQARGRRGAPTAETTPPTETYQFLFAQPIDHANPNLGTFNQRVYVTMTNPNNPVILNTEGYAANGPGGSGELGRLFSSAPPNVVTIEHRYFGRSVPSIDGKTPWKYLTVKNSADDHHAVVTALKTLLHGKWLATGTSKGGQTALFDKVYYPDDVSATVAYVAPVNIGQEDPRINIFINSVGDEATRNKIKQLQIALFKHEDEIIPLCHLDPANFSLGVANAYEYGVLEYPYYFWQYGQPASAIPDPNSDSQTLATYYMRINTIRYYSDSGKKQFEPFLYQAMTEIGYYNYDITDFKPYMKALKNPTNLDICPPGTKDTIVYNPDTMAHVFHELQYNSQNIIFIYGETDAWSSTQMQLLGRTNAVKIVVQNASHSARISAASPEQKKQIFDALDQWMDTKVNRQ